MAGISGDVTTNARRHRHRLKIQTLIWQCGIGTRPLFFRRTAALPIRRLVRVRPSPPA